MVSVRLRRIRSAESCRTGPSVFPPPRLLRMQDDVFQAAVALQEFRCALWPDSIDSGDVVRRVSDNGEIFGNLGGRHSEFLLDLLRSHADPGVPLFGIRDDDVFIGGELGDVLVMGDDLDRESVSASGDCGDEVVRLQSLLFDDGPTECQNPVADERDLGFHRVGHGWALRLVFGADFHSMDRFPLVEDKCAMCGWKRLVQLEEQPRDEYFHA